MLLFTGKVYEESESETEVVTNETSTPTSPRKRINSRSEAKSETKPAANGMKDVSFPPVRRDMDGLAPMEQRKCPIQDCDSSGNNQSDIFLFNFFCG